MSYEPRVSGVKIIKDYTPMVYFFIHEIFILVNYWYINETTKKRVEDILQKVFSL